MRRALSLLLAAALVAGCGEGEGVSSGATVTVYVSSPLCAEAREELGRSGGRAGSFRVRALCLDDTGRGPRALAVVGANARRATEDSTTVGYLGELDPAQTRFSHPILDAAGIAQVSGLPGERAMAIMLRAIRRAGDSEGLREAVRDRLAGR